MPSRSPFLARVAQALLVSSALSLATAGCGGPPGGGTNRPPLAAEGPIKPLDVRDEDFSATLLSLLADGTRSPTRDAALAGVVKRQLAHAEKRFSIGQAERGTNSVMGALYLVRVNEGNAAMVDETGARALDGAIHHLSNRGDEGRVYALMRMRTASLAANATGRAELDDHVQNLERWLADTHAGSPGVRLGAEARYLVARAMVDPSEQALKAAADAVEAWVARGIEINRIYQRTGKRPERPEGMEAARALETGAATLAALYVRHGEAARALERLEGPELRLITEPALKRTLIAAEDGDGRAWEMLAAIFAHEGAPTEADEDDRGERLDPMLVEAGLWGSVLEAYRKDPTSFSTAAVLSEQLLQMGLSEAAPAVLAKALGAEPSPRYVAAACRIVFEAMAVDADSGDTDAVHRTFRAAAPLLAIADKPAYAGLEPSPSRLRLLMASVELRTGDLASARPLYAAAAKANPSVSSWLRVARGDRQAGDRAAALESVRQATSAPDARFALADLTEAHLLVFELQRDAGLLVEARAALGEALATAIAGQRQKGDVGARARSETLLGRVLDAYGDGKAARRAHERALSLAAQDRPVLGATVLQVVSRAFVRRDLEAARAALHQGLDADVDQEERVYGGLWVFLLERLNHVAPDDITQRALAPNGDRDAWVAKLASWANGKMTEEALFASAQNAAQKVEAEFYTAVARKAAGDPAADARLRKVAESPVLDLVEVELARDLLATPFRADLPSGVTLP